MRTYRFHPLVLAALTLLAAGVALEDAAVTVSSVIPLTYVLYSEVTGEGDATVDVERSLSGFSAVPGEEFEVEVKAVNDGESPVGDVRVVDLVPDGLHVVDGEPGVSGSLEPGEVMSTRYRVRLRRGEHRFTGTEVHVRNTSGSRDVGSEVDVRSTVVCRYPLDGSPEPRDTLLGGAVASDEAGEGVEFHSVREYRQGDSLSRVDWRRLAKHGELSTVEYHEERSLDAVVVLDARQPCFQAPSMRHPDAVEYGVYALERLYAAVRATGGTPWVSVYSLAGSLPPTADLPPADVSGVVEDRVRELRRDSRTWVGGDFGSATGDYVRAVDEHLLDRMEVYMVSPLLDEAAAEAAREFAARDRDVTVYSPDVCFGDTTPKYVEGFRRRRRIRGLMEVVDVVDWDVRRRLEEVIMEGSP